jgi:protein SCO1/2
MSNKIKSLRLTIVILLAIVAFMAGLFVSQHHSSKNMIDLKQLHGTALKHPHEVSPFSLQGTNNKPFNNVSLNGSWTMMFFGFTHCGYVCPTTMAELGKMYRLLQERGVPVLPQVVMISVDPTHDSTDVLSNYVHAFDAHFYGARGSDAAVKRLAEEVGIAYFSVPDSDKTVHSQDNIEHTGTIILFNPKGQLVAFFTSPHHADFLARDYQLLTAQMSSQREGNNRL